MGKLKVFEAFAGVGSQRMALNRLDIDFEIVGICEIDKFALKSYEAIHGECPNFGDISKVDVNDLPNMDLFTYSFPCFIKGTKVLTYEGYKNIEDIKSGDRVLTHTNSYKKVVKPMINKTKHIYELNAMCSDTLYVTEEHPFYVRKKSRIWNNTNRCYDRVFNEPNWVKVKDLSKKYYVGIAINRESKLPKWDGVVFNWSDGRKSRKSNILTDKFGMSEFWWIIGRYLGDGWIRHQGGIIICCDFEETNEIEEKLISLNFNYSISKERTTNKIHIAFKEIGEYVKQFGRGAKNKHLTGDIINLPTHLLKGFLDGYMSADGCFTQGLNKATSISRELIYGIGQCVAKVYNRPFSIYKTIRKKTTTIEGRLVNQNDSYTITWKNDSNKQDKAFYENGYIWCPINSVNRSEYDGLVYNMEVEDDNSYVVQNIIVHNCQDLSTAGKQKGLSEGTRSGLLYECEKIIENKKPKYLLLENVKNLVGKKFKKDFDKWLEYLEGLGYINYWKILNAKNFNVPQNRERVFVVSILNDKQGFEFPKPIQLDKTIKDILIDNVEESYYIDSQSILFHDRGKLINGHHFCRQVGRNLENPTSRKVGLKTNQVIELNNKNIANTLTTAQKDNCVFIRQATKKGYIEMELGGVCDLSYPNSKTRRGRVQEGGKVSPTLTAATQNIVNIDTNYRVRKLTPLECWRLMDFSDEDFYKAKNAGISNSQLYKQAGNSIVVKVLEEIFKNLLLQNTKNNLSIEEVKREEDNNMQLKYII